MTNLKHPLSYFVGLDVMGRPDLAAKAAASDGRQVIALHYAKKAGMAPQQAFSEHKNRWIR